MKTFPKNTALLAENPHLVVELAKFEQKIVALSQDMGLNLADYEIDHVALRVNHLQTAKNWLTLLLKYGRILSDNIINGRPIYLIELDSPIKIVNQFIDVIELPFPKNKQYPQENWEHIEIVMPFLANESIEQWKQRIHNQFLWKNRSNLMVKVSEPKAEGESGKPAELLPNPSIAVSFVDKSTNDVCIKVHPYNIKKILEV